MLFLAKYWGGHGPPGPPPPLSRGPCNILIKDESRVAGAFNDYFSSIAQNLQDKIPEFGDFEEIVRGISSSDYFFFTQSEMLKTLSSLNLSKSTGDFSIPKQIFSLIPNDLANILTSLINLTFETGVFPSSLKIVKENSYF